MPALYIVLILGAQTAGSGLPSDTCMISCDAFPERHSSFSLPQGYIWPAVLLFEGCEQTLTSQKEGQSPSALLAPAWLIALESQAVRCMLSFYRIHQASMIVELAVQHAQQPSRSHFWLPLHGRTGCPATW